MPLPFMNDDYSFSSLDTLSDGEWNNCLSDQGDEAMSRRVGSNQGDKARSRRNQKKNKWRELS